MEQLYPTGTTIVTALAMAVTNVGGTLAIRTSLEPNKQVYFALGVVAYVVGAALYVALLKEQSLAVLAVVTSTLQLGLLISVSIWFFDEKVNVVQGSAMAVAVVAAAISMLAVSH